MNLTALEAHDLIVHCALLEDRLTAALAGIAKKQRLEKERGWLGAAIELVHATREGCPPLLERALGLPELTWAREEHALEVQGRWVDGLERLLAGITFHAGSRAPILETLFPKQKLPSLRKAKKEVVEAYAADFEKRLGSGYVKRMLAGEAFAFALPVLEELRNAYTAWSGAWGGQLLGEEQAEALRSELMAKAKEVDLPIRQAKLLAEAALAPVNGAFEASEIGHKPRKRTPKPQVQAVESTPAPVVEEAPPAAEASPVAAAPEEKPTPKKRAKARPAAATETA